MFAPNRSRNDVSNNIFKHTRIALNAPSIPAIDHQHRDRIELIKQAIDDAAHLLPTQAPIRVFVHHNTLHAFEDRDFDDAIELASAAFGSHAYLPEHRYREKLARGRILPRDLSAELVEDLGDNADQFLGFLGTRFHLRLAMLQHPLRHGSQAELQWLIAETDTLRAFRSETPSALREQMIEETRRWVLRDLLDEKKSDQDLARTLFSEFPRHKIEKWKGTTWEAVTLRLLWEAIHRAVTKLPADGPGVASSSRPHERPVRESDFDVRDLVDQELIRFCGVYLDQGVATWTLPERQQGFLHSWMNLFADTKPVKSWMHELPGEIQRIRQRGWTPVEIINDALDSMGIPAADIEAYLRQTLFALPGWAGMILQLETTAQWVPFPAKSGSLIEYVAVRLILEKLAIRHTTKFQNSHQHDYTSDGSDPAGALPKADEALRRTHLVFQLAQVIGWKPEFLARLSASEWRQLIREIESFTARDRQRIYQHAFERRLRIQTLDAIGNKREASSAASCDPEFQLVCCLDEREESLRRHVEEVAPRCETFGIAGFFGVAMYYKGLHDASFIPLCPIAMTPRHYVEEEVENSFSKTHDRRTTTRRRIGKLTHRLYYLSRSAVGGAVTALLGALASAPLVAAVLFPRLTTQVRRKFAGLWRSPPITRQTLESTTGATNDDGRVIGFALDEMIAITARVLGDLGITKHFSRIVVFLGHGSSSLNNPHSSAYNCGACGGGNGGPNARALAGMLSDPRVREGLRLKGIQIPDSTVFVGACHNTCDDSVEYFDLDRLPSTHRKEFETTQAALLEACQRNAQERCRRFESAELFIAPENAIRHVQARASDLSQVRPECGHATNAVCIVGRRDRTKGLFMDRRTFLASYDPTSDTDEFQVLERILQGVVPVCAGISLEYYFCYVDPSRYGCGSKLPHNLAGLIGVMDGAASDLRPGLPWQMIEIHEPVRVLFVVEARPPDVLRVLSRNPDLSRLVTNHWVQLATLDPNSSKIHFFHQRDFEEYLPESSELPKVSSSVEWFRGWRDHLGFACVVPTNNSASIHHGNRNKGIK